ncbi:plasmid partitioning protein RepB [Rhizobium sp. KVB221]|uniref:Plasmid partitioning protein RepB n=1 Tax=Rhizobium setariae TaxID=2801340 RepID=A0A936YQ87_9HYPH|nr:plasmid partitioning protein RepB [Rhizobium setariae]
MARKNPFANLMDDKPANEGLVALDYTIKGASRSIISSIDELAERADKLLEGETVVELDPATIDESFVRDRIEDDAQEFGELVNAIRERGQDSPILVRPHPRETGRYMVVFGHRRVRAARELGRNVRAVVKAIEDRDHVVAQGQENSARANLSFIEKAVFAGKLSKLNYDNDNATVLAALSVDKATLSKMLSVAALPSPVLGALSGAKSIGRDRWYELKLLLEKPATLEKAFSVIEDEALLALDPDLRFGALVDHLKSKRKASKPKATPAKNWVPADKSVSVDIKNDGKRYVLALKARDAVGFGEFISANLDALYDDFRRQKSMKQGD